MPETTRPAPPARGDEADLFATHADRLVRVVGRRVDAPAWMVEDACQFAWAQLLSSQPDRDRVFGWLATTAIRHVWRQSERFGRCASLDVVVGEWPGAPLLVEALPGPCPQENRRAREALIEVSRLGAAQRYAMARSIAGLSREEICEESGLTARQVDRHLVKARRALRRGI